MQDYEQELLVKDISVKDLEANERFIGKLETIDTHTGNLYLVTYKSVPFLSFDVKFMSGVYFAMYFPNEGRWSFYPLSHYWDLYNKGTHFRYAVTSITNLYLHSKHTNEIADWYRGNK